jgi:signal transduction histidine kinase
MSVASVVAANGTPLAQLVHDPALDDDPGLVDAGVALTRLVVDNARLSDEVNRQLAEVRASRARIIEAGDEERRRIERDLHDGVQQRLVALGLRLRRAAARSSSDPAANEALARGADEALAVVGDVRELARGIHPAVLSEAGLGSALRALADRSPVPVELDLRLRGAGTPTAVSTAYFVASEALANVAKHAHAGTVWLHASDDDALEVRVEDDGLGGADPDGAGVRGLEDRVAALNGRFGIGPRPAGGTIVSATIPLA